MGSFAGGSNSVNFLAPPFFASKHWFLVAPGLPRIKDVSGGVFVLLYLSNF